MKMERAYSSESLVITTLNGVTSSMTSMEWIFATFHFYQPANCSENWALRCYAGMQRDYLDTACCVLGSRLTCTAQ